MEDAEAGPQNKAEVPFEATKNSRPMTDLFGEQVYEGRGQQPRKKRAARQPNTGSRGWPEPEPIATDMEPAQCHTSATEAGQPADSRESDHEPDFDQLLWLTNFSGSPNKFRPRNSLTGLPDPAFRCGTYIRATGPDRSSRTPSPTNRGISKSSPCLTCVALAFLWYILGRHEGHYCGCRRRLSAVHAVDVPGSGDPLPGAFACGIAHRANRASREQSLTDCGVVSLVPGPLTPDNGLSQSGASHSWPTGRSGGQCPHECSGGQGVTPARAQSAFCLPVMYAALSSSPTANRICLHMAVESGAGGRF